MICFNLRCIDDRDQLEVTANEREKLHRFTAKERKDVAIQFVSNDPGDDEFLDFRVIKGTSSLKRYRALNIFNLQKFVTSLGGKCLKTTVKKGKPNNECCSKAETMASASEIFMHSAENKLLSFSDALSCLPAAFYYTEHNSLALSGDFIKQSVLPGSVLPLYDASVQLPPLIRRAMHDNFRPPHGKAVPYLHSFGYGKEVGLPDGMHEVSVEASIFVLDHNEHIVRSTNQVTRSSLALPTKWKYSYNEQIEFTAQ